MKKLIIVGTSNNSKLARYYFERDTPYEVIGYTVENEYVTSPVFDDLPVIPLDSITDTHPTTEFDVFVAVGYSKMNKVRELLFNKVTELGYYTPNYISPDCNCRSKKIGLNNFILEDNTIQPYVEIGDNNVLWSGNHIGHDVKIGNNNFITSHVVVSGFTVIENNCFLGVNSCFRDDIKISNYTLIGAGASIMKSTKEEEVLLANKPFELNKSSLSIEI